MITQFSQQPHNVIFSLLTGHLIVTSVQLKPQKMDAVQSLCVTFNGTRVFLAVTFGCKHRRNVFLLCVP